MKITYEMPELFTTLFTITFVIIFTIGKMAPEEKVTKQKTPILKLKQEGQRAENKLTVHNTLLFFCRHKNPVLRHTDIVEQKKEPSHNHKSRSETVLLRCPSSTIKTAHSVL